MLHIKSKKITLPLCLCIISMLLTPTIVSAATSTGDIAAIRAAEQKAALAKKAAQKEAKKAAETKKTTEAQVPSEEPKTATEGHKDAAETQVPAEDNKEK